MSVKTKTVCLFFAISCSLALSAGQDQKITLAGDIIIGGLFPVHKEGDKENECGELNDIPGYQYMEAMLYALEKINNNTDILPGIKLGTVIYDTCRSPTITPDKTKEFIKMTLVPEEANVTELAGVIGPFTSGNSIIVANFLRVFEIPQISYASLSVKLSDKSIYNYFFRTVPPDSFFAEALSVLLKRLGWSYVSIIYSKGLYPESGTQEVIKALKQKSICIATKHRLPRFPEAEDFDEAMRIVSAEKKANVVIFVTIQRDSRGLLKAKLRNPGATSRLTIVGSVAWSNRDDITNGLGEAAQGTLTFGHREGNIDEFTKHLRSMNLTNYKEDFKGWFHEFWQKQFNCSVGSTSNLYTKKCTGKESLQNEDVNMEIAPVRVVINAVNAMAYAIHNMHKALCPNQETICARMIPFPRKLLRDFLKNVTFPDFSFGWSLRFDAHNEVEGNYTLLNFRKDRRGHYNYDPVGSWVSERHNGEKISGDLVMNVTDIVWINQTMPDSVCSHECDVMSIRVTSNSRNPECCWECEACASNEIIVNNTCAPCDEDFTPDGNRTHCFKRLITYVNIKSAGSVIIIFLACTGFVAVLVVSTVFVVYGEHRLIKASAREMCFIMLIGIFMVFMIPVTTLAKPSQPLCYFRRLLAGISFTFCYVPLFLKIWRIHRIFKRAEQLRKVGALVGRRTLTLIAAGLITVQGLFCILIFSADPPTLQETFYKAQGILVLECASTPSVFVAYLAYNVILMLLCTIYAFLTRKFPKNYNEATYIGVTMYLTCVVWVVFVACFLNQGDSIERAYWISGASVIIGWITILGLFAPKMYQLYTKQQFDDNKLVNWATTSYQQSESTHVTNSEGVMNTIGLDTKTQPELENANKI